MLERAREIREDAEHNAYQIGWTTGTAAVNAAAQVQARNEGYELGRRGAQMEALRMIEQIEEGAARRIEQGRRQALDEARHMLEEERRRGV